MVGLNVFVILGEDTKVWIINYTKVSIFEVTIVTAITEIHWITEIQLRKITHFLVDKIMSGIGSEIPL